MGNKITKDKKDTDYSNKIFFLNFYEYREYTPVHYYGDNYFESRIREITPESILFLYRPNEAKGSYWWILEYQHYKNINFGSSIVFDDKKYTYLAVPRGINCYAGVVGKEDSPTLKKEKQQIYIPRDILQSLIPLSDKFKSRTKSRDSEKKYIKDVSPIIAIQSSHKKDYMKKYKNMNDILIINRLERDLLRIFSLTSRSYSNTNLQNLVIELNNLKEKMLTAISKTDGENKEEVIDMLKSLIKFQEIVVTNITNNTNWGNNFEDILEICRVRDNPKLGNLFHQCDENFKNLFLNGDVLSSVENTEHIIHKRKSDGYLIKVRITKDYGDNNFIAEFY